MRERKPDIVPYSPPRVSRSMSAHILANDALKDHGALKAAYASLSPDARLGVDAVSRVASGGNPELQQTITRALVAYTIMDPERITQEQDLLSLIETAFGTDPSDGGDASAA